MISNINLVKSTLQTDMNMVIPVDVKDIESSLGTSFHDLSKSENFEDRQMYDFFINLLDELFGKHDNIQINKECETEKNQELIKSQWNIIKSYFKITASVKHTQRCVRQTIQHSVNYLNHKYQFTQPIKFNTIQKNVRVKKRVISLCYTEFSLT